MGKIVLDETELYRAGIKTDRFSSVGIECLEATQIVSLFLQREFSGTFSPFENRPCFTCTGNLKDCLVSAAFTRGSNLLKPEEISDLYTRARTGKLILPTKCRNEKLRALIHQIQVHQLSPEPEVPIVTFDI